MKRLSYKILFLLSQNLTEKTEASRTGKRAIHSRLNVHIKSLILTRMMVILGKTVQLKILLLWRTTCGFQSCLALWLFGIADYRSHQRVFSKNIQQQSSLFKGLLDFCFGRIIQSHSWQDKPEPEPFVFFNKAGQSFLVGPLVQKEVLLPDSSKRGGADDWIVAKNPEHIGSDGRPRFLLKSQSSSSVGSKWVDQLFNSKRAVPWSVEAKEEAVRHSNWFFSPVTEFSMGCLVDIKWFFVGQHPWCNSISARCMQALWRWDSQWWSWFQRQVGGAWVFGQSDRKSVV